MIDVIGYNSNQFDKCFRILTNESLYEYIVVRKLVFVSQDILENKDKKLCDVAQDFGYSEQSVLNRTMKLYFNCTPGEIRSKCIRLPNDKYSLSYFQDRKFESRVEGILRQFEQGGIITSINFEYLEKIHALADDYGFDIDTAYQIAELAERLDIPVSGLMYSCFDLMGNSPEDLSEKTMIGVTLGLKSDEEYDEICRFYQCKYYDLSSFMVQKYRQINNSDNK